MNQEREYRHTSAEGIEENIEDGEARRDFLKKLTYVAPIMITFQMDDAEVSDDDGGKKKKSSKKKSKVSPKPKTKKKGKKSSEDSIDDRFVGVQQSFLATPEHFLQIDSGFVAKDIRTHMRRMEAAAAL